jgi:hypothetical protein
MKKSNLIFFLCFFFSTVLLGQYNMIAPPQNPYDCVHCTYNYNQYYGPRPNVPFYPYQNYYGYYPYNAYSSPYYNPYGQYPWWNNYGMMRYSNYHYPGHWNYQGNYPNYPSYPGSGGVVAMKPNVYISAKPGTHFDLDIEFLEGSNLLIASPSLSSKWQGKITNEGELEVAGTSYRYLYYDYRFAGKHLQREAGFCGQKVEVVKQMAGVLNELGFVSHEIKDFLDHWPTKMPSSPYYCVFPQETKELEKEVRLKILGNPYELTQINFLVMPKEVMNRQLASTIKPWLSSKKSLKQPELLQVREWGVSFGK